MFDDYVDLDAVAQAELVRDGLVSPVELVEAAIARVEALNPRLNAVVTTSFERAREAAGQPLPDSPLSGIPYLIKDLSDYSGERCTCGSRLLAAQRASANASIVQKLIDAGLIMLGKTNTAEFGLAATTEPLLLGPTLNPWNLERSPGGSSGGAAAAVAAAMLPVAHATDGGGSIRMPASCCGVFGLKPSRGRMRLDRVLPGDIGTENCVSRSVRDSAMIFALSEDPSPDARFAPVGFVSHPSPRRLRIAFRTANIYGEEPHSEVKVLTEDTARVCADLGHEIVEVGNPIDGSEFIDAFLTLWSSVPAELVALAQSRGLKPDEHLEPWTLGLAEFFLRKPEGAVAAAVSSLAAVQGQLEAFLAQYDAWLTPVLFTPPPRLGEQGPNVPFQTLLERTVRYASYTPIHNAAGTTAMSVPLQWTADGLPVGSQFAAAAGREATLFSLAYELEAARPWVHRQPRVSVLHA